MPTRKLPNYLRTYRKRAGLSQDEIAFLLGARSGAKVSRYERFRREPSLRTALAYESVFRIPVRELFAGIYEEAELKTLKRRKVLIARLSKKSTPDRMTARKIVSLTAGLPADAGDHTDP
ncbi:MAG: helix-turn-helix transcriptional regulator [Acidobacteria bacterium]|nr:helix-turn-helix transcriptional regulator [Acidobacteriota bacterium]